VLASSSAERYLTRCSTWDELQPLLQTRLSAQSIGYLEGLWEDAVLAHGQQQRPDGRPFSTHLAEALELLIVGTNNADPVVFGAALLHDIVEDTKVTLDDVHHRYGETIAEMVEWLTIPQALNASREQTRTYAFTRLVQAPPIVRQIKLADRLSTVQRIDNHPSINKQIQRYRETVTYILPIAASFEWFAKQFRLWHQTYSYLEPLQQRSRSV
jgi:guanosine-3',5'-bis(diphosphate) 3'-pyrophosphohydrolase